MITPRDFTHYTRFPGTDSSRFDALIRIEDALDAMPALVFGVLLYVLALVPGLGDPFRALFLWAFFLSDWLLIALLARAHKSFGPSKPATLLLAILRLVPGAFPMPWIIPAQLLGTALLIYGFWIEPHRIGVTYQKLQTPKWKSPHPLRVLHLGDLHVERTTERERQLVRLVQSLKPDLILFSGDFLSLSNVYDRVSWEDTRQILQQLTAPLGTYVVTGSPPVDCPDAIAEMLKGLNVRWLKSEQVTLDCDGQEFDVVGLTCTHRPFVDAPRLDSILKGKPEKFTILLYHTPDLAPEAALRGIDLQLSGHTHGGQVRLPWFGALYTASLYGKKLDMGRYQLGGMTLYVSRGIGMEGKGAPRVRFLCPPEIVLWEISGEHRGG